MFLGFLRQVSDMLCYLNNNSTAIPILKIKETLHPAPLLPSNPMGMYLKSKKPCTLHPFCLQTQWEWAIEWGAHLGKSMHPPYTPYNKILNSICV